VPLSDPEACRSAAADAWNANATEECRAVVSVKAQQTVLCTIRPMYDRGSYCEPSSDAA